jgi:hypothetical protein
MHDGDPVEGHFDGKLVRANLSVGNPMAMP